VKEENEEILRRSVHEEEEITGSYGMPWRKCGVT